GVTARYADRTDPKGLTSRCSATSAGTLLQAGRSHIRAVRRLRNFFPESSTSWWCLSEMRGLRRHLGVHAPLEIFATHWPNAPKGDPVGDTMNSTTKYVASTTLKEPLEWQNSVLLQGDAGDAVADLKSRPGKHLVLVGSGDFAQTLMQRNL